MKHFFLILTEREILVRMLELRFIMHLDCCFMMNDVSCEVEV